MDSCRILAGFLLDFSLILTGFFLDSSWIFSGFFLDSFLILSWFFLDSCRILRLWRSWRQVKEPTGTRDGNNWARKEIAKVWRRARINQRRVPSVFDVDRRVLIKIYEDNLSEILDDVGHARGQLFSTPTSTTSLHWRRDVPPFPPPPPLSLSLPLSFINALHFWSNDSSRIQWIPWITHSCFSTRPHGGASAYAPSLPPAWI